MEIDNKLDNAPDKSDFRVQSKQIIKTITDVKILHCVIEPFTSANISVQLLGANGEPVGNKHLYMPRSTYLQWGNDDRFLTKWVLSELDIISV